MNCDEALDVLLPLSLGSLDESEAGPARRHLVGCARCQGREARLLQAFRRVGEAQATPPGFWDRILEADQRAVPLARPVLKAPPVIRTEGAKMSPVPGPPRRSRLRPMRMILLGALIVGAVGTYQFGKLIIQRTNASMRERERAHMAAMFEDRAEEFFRLFETARSPGPETAEARERWSGGKRRMVVFEGGERRGLSAVQLSLESPYKASYSGRVDVLVMLSYSREEVGPFLFRSRRDPKKERRVRGFRQVCRATYIDLESGAFLGALEIKAAVPEKVRYPERSRVLNFDLPPAELAKRLSVRPW